MKKDSRVFKHGNVFINDFFQGFKEHTKIRSADYFKLFQQPLDFPDLLELCLPSAPPRVLLLDGQSRVGKTWTAVGLVREMLDRQLIDAVWSSGEDSCFVYPDNDTTVAEGIHEVAVSLRSFLEKQKSQAGLRLIVLLDDFFGSARLRELFSNPTDFQLVKDTLTADGTQNPLLIGLSPYEGVQASVLMTGRSSIFAAAEIRLGVPLGGRAERVGRAFFQTVDGKLVGGGASEWLDECLKQHSAFIIKHKEFTLPPMTAFSSRFPSAEPFGSDLPDILFGGDIRAIIREIQLANGSYGSSDPVTYSRLRRLLLVYVAPALVLPLPSIDSCLTGAENSRRVRAVLSLQPEERGDFALRVPNRYYLRAIQEELLNAESLQVMADSLSAHAEELQEDRCEKHLSILSRGLIERGLESLEELLKKRPNGEKENVSEIRTSLSEMVQALPGAKQEPLLQWEAALASDSLESQAVADVFDRIPREPGLASAIGWGLYRFRRVSLFSDSNNSFALKNICRAFEDRAKEIHEDSDHRILTVSYSNFIRWAAQIEEAPAEFSPIDQLARVSGSKGKHPGVAAGLKMVLEDALIWADSFQVAVGGPCLSVRRLPSAKELWDALESESPQLEASPNRDASVIANRLFSLEWHNEWKEREGYRRDVLWNWLQNNRKSALQLIAERPELLDDNLAYHWSHMITQWSVWARDWCFSPDPNAHEYKKETIGCRAQENNEGIREILKEAIDSTFKSDNPQNRFRNAFFLLAIRSGGPSYEDLAATHAYLSGVIDRASETSNGIRKDLNQAIYELIRQGYVDWIENSTDLQEGDDRQYLLPKDLQAKCVDFVHHYGSREWHSYLNELKSITCLDVLPQSERDLVPYGRATDVIAKAS